VKLQPGNVIRPSQFWEAIRKNAIKPRTEHPAPPLEQRRSSGGDGSGASILVATTVVGQRITFAPQPDVELGKNLSFLPWCYLQLAMRRPEVVPPLLQRWREAPDVRIGGQRATSVEFDDSPSPLVADQPLGKRNLCSGSG
jgi:hypothetical protein